MRSEHRPEGGTPGQDRARASHDHPPTPALVEFMTQGWDSPGSEVAPLISGAASYRARREEVSQSFPGMLIVVPAGMEKIRANDTTYPFRATTDYLYLVGEAEPDEVLVMEPLPGGGHRASIFTEPAADFTKSDFFTDRVKGVFWVGPGRGVSGTESRLGISARPISELPRAISPYDRGVALRGVDATVDRLVSDLAGPDDQLVSRLSEMRLIKDSAEIEYLEEACELTRQGFEDVVRALPQARTERDVEVAFFARARSAGNDTGYPTIAAAGSHGTILHWSQNTGELRRGELLLLDAGVETNRYYTADVTRTMPVDGHFTPTQRRVYQLVYDAQQAGFAEVKPGNDFDAPNRAAMRVLAAGLEELGLLPVSAQESVHPDSQLHRRYTLHSVSHMLGLDVHDCAKARAENYRQGKLRPGMVLTVEPGLYFQSHDLTVPEELRGIGVRIEDDLLVTEDGHRVLSAGLPSAPEDVERWMAELWAGSAG
ncbi:MAG TPA: aminopeptidase P family protein [Candidatus Micrarchaeaceae archaeon]|nr:aminopeptidase P family protein [Candidatus Micrarchaeaceae archaeon]